MKKYTKDNKDESMPGVKIINSVSGRQPLRGRSLLLCLISVGFLAGTLLPASFIIADEIAELPDLNLVTSPLETAHLTAVITSPEHGVTIDVGQDFTVTADVTNTGDGEAQQVMAEIGIVADAHIVSGDNPQQLGDLNPGESATATWQVHCDGAGLSFFSVTPSGIDPDPMGTGIPAPIPTTNIEQDQILLTQQMSHLLSVPYFNEGTTKWCVPNSVAMVMQYWGASVHPWDIAVHEELKYGINEGFDTSQVNALLEFINQPEYGLTAAYIYGYQNFPFYVAQIDSNIPTVFHASPGGSELRMAVVIGYEDGNDERYLYIHDPSGAFTQDIWGKQDTVAVKVEWLQFLELMTEGGHDPGHFLIQGQTPGPPAGTLSLFSGSHLFAQRILGNQWAHTIVADQVFTGSGLSMGPEGYTGNDVGLWANGPVELSKDRTIELRTCVANHDSSAQDYFLEVEILDSQSNDQIFVKAYDEFPVAPKTLANIKSIIERQTLKEWGDGDYEAIVRLYIVFPDSENSALVDSIGPFPFTITRIQHYENGVNLFAPYQPLQAEADMCAAIHFGPNADEWELLFYADVYEIDQDGSRIGVGEIADRIDFKLTVYDESNAVLLDTQEWHTTDTNGDGSYGDPSGNGGMLPCISFQGTVDWGSELPEEIIFRTIWRHSISGGSIISQEIDSLTIRIEDIIDTILFQAACPVDLVIVNPDGFSVDKDSSEVPGALYVESDTNDTVSIQNPKSGDYEISVIPEPEALPTDTFTLTATIRNDNITLATNTPIEDIPTEPYIVSYSSLPIQGYRDIQLKEGWNLVGIPLIPDDSNIESLLSGIMDNVISVWSYGASDTNSIWRSWAPGWGGELTDMIDCVGYWINMQAADTLTVEGLTDLLLVESMYLPLKEGWNLISLPFTTSDPSIEIALDSIVENVISAWSYDTDNPGNPWTSWAPGWGGELTEIIEGKGYWINMSCDDTLTFENSSANMLN